MTIQKLEIHGYRSFEHAVWEPGKLNLLVGPNGSGKSNLLRLLELISDVAAGRLSKAVVKAGGMVPILWNQEASSLGWKLTIDPVDEGRDIHEDAITFELEVAASGGSGYVVSRDMLGNWVQYEKQAADSPYWIFKRDLSEARVYDQQTKGLTRILEYDSSESLLAQLSDPRVNPIPTRAKRTLERWGIYHDIDVGYQSQIRQPAVTQYSKVIERDACNLTAVLHTLYTENRDFRQQIDDGMWAAFGAEFVELSFPPAAAQMIQLGVQWSSSKQPHVGRQLSDGTLRYLLLLTVLAHPDPPPLIALDEPETGLHPSMFPLVAEYAVAAAERTQVMITSHSPEFLDAFTEHEPCVTIGRWEDGRTRLLPIPSDRLQEWLRQYRLGHLFTSGELDIVAAPEVDVDDDTEDRFANLPSDVSSLPPGAARTGDAAHD